MTTSSSINGTLYWMRLRFEYEEDLAKLLRDPSHVLLVKPWKLEADDTVLLDLQLYLDCKPGVATSAK